MASSAICTKWLKSIPEYKDNTLFIVTSDHGRGDGREGWKNHSVLLPGSERIWIAAFGPGLSVSGVEEGGKFEQAQVAATRRQVSWPRL
ncbi:AP protein [Biomphalaria pfeifferi]|uniref:AP protein n=1 Tax=Biomphalaria pfeifferi TaxID=112525 RepID=A0AAD8ETV9_BIOPF|nr:AP protein [Biomphalaria pfeifferi]